MVIRKKLSTGQYLFILGLFAKQFYVLQSGSVQLGDILIILGCFCHLFLKKRGKLQFYNKSYPFLLYFLCVLVINSFYSVLLHNSGFNRSSLYYLYNTIIILTFYDFLLEENTNEEFLKEVGIILKLSLIVQFVVYYFGLGRWIYSTRYGGTFNDPNQYGVYIFFVIILTYIIDKICNNKKWYIWSILGFIIILPSTSTGTMLGTVVFFAGVYLASVKYLKRWQKILWGVALFAGGLSVILLNIQIIPLPSFITNNNMYIRVISKINKLTASADSAALLSDRGWNRIIEYPAYMLFGSGEGGYSRFNTSLEIHSSIIGPLFYYGIFPFLLYIYWILNNIVNKEFIYIYVSLLIEALFLVNTRQPFYWIIIILAGYRFKKSK